MIKCVDLGEDSLLLSVELSRSDVGVEVVVVVVSTCRFVRILELSIGFFFSLETGNDDLFAFSAELLSFPPFFTFLSLRFSGFDGGESVNEIHHMFNTRSKSKKNADIGSLRNLP
jgi:hypothetical protein